MATTRKTTAPAASTSGTDVDAALVQRTPARKTATRKPAAAKAPVVKVPAPVVEQAPAKKAPKVRPADIPVDGCSSLQGGVKLNCEHTTYASDPHCRRRDCANDIRQCTVHVLGKGGVVTVVAAAK
jgi:hypothetical protein